MGGHRQGKVKTIQRGQDPTDEYQIACALLADEIGWDSDSVVFWWSQLALARMHCGEPQPVAEFLAMRMVREALDQRGRDAN